MKLRKRVRWQSTDNDVDSKDGIFVKTISLNNNVFISDDTLMALVIFDDDDEASKVPYHELSAIVHNTDLEIIIRVGRHEEDWRDRRDTIFVSAFEEEECFVVEQADVLETDESKLNDFVISKSAEMIKNILENYNKNKKRMTTEAMNV